MFNDLHEYEDTSPRINLDEIDPNSFRARQMDVELFQKGFRNLPKALADYGFSELREGQEQGVMSILGGVDTLCIFSTSIGKTATFIIPALCHNWRLLVFSPLKALMRDQVKGLQARGLVALKLSSDESEAENSRTIQDWVNGNCKILYVAPERLQNPQFLQALRRMPPEMLAVDESHCLSSWGDNFRHSYQHIGDIIDRFNPRVVAAFTATFSKLVERDVRRVLRMPAATKITHLPTRKNLLLSSSNRDERDDLIPRVQAISGRRLLYCGSQKNTEKIAVDLSHALRQEVGFYHAGVAESVKKRNQDAFADGSVEIMCATNAFGMGIDIAAIRAVIHVSHPGDPEALMQECVHPDSYISTYYGQKSANEVVQGEIMLDFNFGSAKVESARVVAVMENKTENLKEVRTKMGSTLRATPSHPVYVLRGDSIEEVPTGELCVGDKLLAKKDLAPAEVYPVTLISLLEDCPEPIYVEVLPDLVERLRVVLDVQAIAKLFRLHRLYDYNAYKTGKCGRLAYWLEACQAAGISEAEFSDAVVAFKTRSSQKIKLPRFVDARFGWLAGIMATDGHIYRTSTGSGYGSWKLKLGNTDSRIIDRFSDLITGMGVNVHSYVRKIKGGELGKKPFIHVEASHPILVHLLAKMGIPSGKKSYTVQVPKWLNSAEIPVRAAFLAGVIDGDGSISKKLYCVRIHSAGWGFLSGLAMLLRGFSIPATCAVEDYTCKAAVMRAASTHGYSLAVSSTEHYEQLRALVEPHACKTYLPLRPPNAGQDMTGQRRSRRIQVVHVGCFWLEDEILELHDVAYTGRVINWRVEPGNQLIVDGILTHNCGRAGRDGLDSVCHTYQSKDALRMQESFLHDGHPSSEQIRKVIKCYEAAADPARMFHLSGEEISERSGVGIRSLGAINQTLLGCRVIEAVKDQARVHKIRFKGPEPDGKWFGKMREAIHGISEPYEGCLGFDLDILSARLQLGSASILKYFRTWQEEKAIDYEPPPRGTPKRLVGDASLVDFERLEIKRKLAWGKLEYVKNYFHKKDENKHRYLEEYFLEHMDAEA
jgi:intein/homing endonuclease